MRVKSFDYRNVELGPGIFKKQRDETLELYLAIDEDSLLKPFRETVGLLAPGKRLLGWYGTGASTFGQVMGALAKLAVSTGDERARKKALALAEGWEACADAGETVLELDSYRFDKTLGGLLDVYEYLGQEKALAYARRLTEAASRRFKRDIKRDGLQDEGLWGFGMIEWYTLPENLLRAYELTGEAFYKDFALEWDYEYFWDKLRRGDAAIGPRHAYSHVNALSSAAKLYEATGDARYLEAAEAGYELVLARHSFATGGYGPAETLFAEKPGYLGDSLKSPFAIGAKAASYRNFSGAEVVRDDTWGSCEVPCCSWAVFKLTRYLLEQRGTARYAEWAERMLYNGMAGELLVSPKGEVMYYSGYYLNGAIKSGVDRRLFAGGQGFTWQCCTGTFPQNVAEYCKLLYYRDDDGIYVSQYMPSTLRWERNGTQLSLANESRYPEEDELRFVIGASKPERFALRLRIPSWLSSEPQILINGKRVECRATPGDWCSIERGWEDGDIVSAQFPFELRFEQVDEANPDIVALCYGPLVLASSDMGELKGDRERPGEWIRALPGESMVFETEAGHVRGYEESTMRFEPYYRIGAMRWYFMYNRIADEEK
jgi:Uncharacterized protein conserved in bacteria